VNFYQTFQKYVGFDQIEITKLLIMTVTALCVFMLQNPLTSPIQLDQYTIAMFLKE